MTPPTGSVRLAPLPDSPAQARSYVSDALEAWGCRALVDPAQLIVSELVTNVVLHAGTDAELSIVLMADRVRIEVSDGNPTIPEIRASRFNSLGGRGLPIIEVVGDAWGVERRAGGKTVWAELFVP